MAKNFNVEVEFKASGHPQLEKAINSLVEAQKNLRNGQVQYNKTLTKSNAAIAHLEKRNKALTKSIVSTNNAFSINAKTGAVVAKNNRLLSNSLLLFVVNYCLFLLVLVLQLQVLVDLLH